MADKKSNEPRRENGRIPTYQTAYHGAKKKDPLTNLARIIVEKFDKRRVPENTIDTIPFDQIYPDGLCRIGDNFYSKMVQFYDINYQLAQNDEKQHIFAEYCQFLNYFDETIHFQFCFINQRVDMEEYKKVISIPDQDDEFNVVRREYATYLRNQLEKGNNGIVKSKYLVFGIEARDRKQAVSRLAKIESDVINKFKLLGCKCVPVNGLERLRIMHDYLNQDSLEKFAMKSFKDVVESGLTPKNFITPTSFDFRAKDYYKMGFGRALGVTLSDAQVKNLLAGKKILVKGIKSKKGSVYDAYLTPTGIAPYSYTDSKGNEKNGFQYEYDMDFPKKK